MKLIYLFVIDKTFIMSLPYAPFNIFTTELFLKITDGKIREKLIKYIFWIHILLKFLYSWDQKLIGKIF